MSRLERLIAEYKKYREKFVVSSKREQAALTLADYMLECSKFWAELERRGRQMVELDRAVKTTPLGQEHADLLMELEKAKAAFSSLLDEHEAWLKEQDA